MLGRVVRRLDPRWAYREEQARQQHPASLTDDRWGWAYSPWAAAVYSVAWQLGGVAGALGLVALVSGRAADSSLATVGFVAGGLALALMCVGTVVETPLVARAAHRRRWPVALTGGAGIVLLRSVDYAFGPRRRTHPHPRFRSGSLSLAPDDAAG